MLGPAHGSACLSPQHPCQSPIAAPTLSPCASNTQGLTTSILRHQNGHLWLPREIDGLTLGQTPLDAQHLSDFGAQSLGDTPLGAAGAARQHSGRHRPRHPAGPPCIQPQCLILSHCIGLPPPKSSRASLYIGPVLDSPPWNSIIQCATHTASVLSCVLTYHHPTVVRRLAGRQQGASRRRSARKESFLGSLCLVDVAHLVLQGQRDLLDACQP